VSVGVAVEPGRVDSPNVKADQAPVRSISKRVLNRTPRIQEHSRHRKKLSGVTLSTPISNVR